MRSGGRGFRADAGVPSRRCRGVMTGFWLAYLAVLPRPLSPLWPRLSCWLVWLSQDPCRSRGHYTKVASGHGMGGSQPPR